MCLSFSFLPLDRESCGRRGECHLMPTSKQSLLPPIGVVQYVKERVSAFHSGRHRGANSPFSILHSPLRWQSYYKYFWHFTLLYFTVFYCTLLYFMVLQVAEYVC